MSHSLLALAKGLPVHSITLFIFGGVSRIEKEAMNASTEFLVGVIGPVSSFAIGGLFYGINALVDSSSPLGAVAFWLGYINMRLALFNLIPGYPLDGGRVLRSIVWAITGNVQKATKIAARVGQGFAYLIIIYGILTAFAPIRGGKGDLVSGLWIAFIGWFLLDAARSSEQAMVFERAIRGARARDIMNSSVALVPADISLAQFFDEYLMRAGKRCCIVSEDGKLLGLMTTHELRETPRDQWGSTIVRQAMRPFDTMKWVEPNADLTKVLEVMQGEDVNQIPVVEGGRLEGLIKREDILRFVRTRAEFNY